MSFSGFGWGKVSDLVFQGTSALSLDAKGRITVPARHREALSALCGNQLTICRHPVGCLMVFPRPAWLEFRANLLKLPFSADAWRRLFLGSALDVEIDSASRVLVSPELRAAAGLDKEVLMLGNGQRLELWDPARHVAHEAETLVGEMPAAIQEFVL